jgi:uncharacterized repeat protein (TIGR01451 family)
MTSQRKASIRVTVQGGGRIKLLAFILLFLVLVLLSLRGGTWAMPGQSPNCQTLPPAGAIAGKVFYDVNGDGQLDSGEEGISGVQVTRDGGAETYESEEDGDYWFPNLAPGSMHEVSVLRLPGLFPTTAEQVTVTMPLTTGTLPAGEGVNVFFGYQRRTHVPAAFNSYLVPVPDLSTSTKGADRAWANAGELVHYTVELRNTGTRAAHTYFSDPIPNGTTVVTSSVEGGTYRSGRVEWSGALEVDAGHTVAFDVRLEEGASGAIINTATIDDGHHDPIQRDASTQVMVTNPGLETGDLSGWQHGGELAQSVSVSEVHDGDYAALLGDPGYGCAGGVPQGRAWLQQSVAVPSEGTPALGFWYRIHTHDHLLWTDGETLGDSFDVYVNGALIFRDNYDNYDEIDPGPAPGCEDEQDLGWQYLSHDLSSYSGQTVTLRFENVSREDGYYNTWTYLDEVAITP